MPEQTVDAPRFLERAPARHHGRRRSPAVELAWKLRWVIGAGAMLVLAVVVVLWARTRPGYDPYGWLVWGNLTIHGKLDTNGAPSWKPLPFVFTVPYALIGHRAMWLWMITSVAVSLSGGVFAARIAYRLVDPPEALPLGRVDRRRVRRGDAVRDRLLHPLHPQCRSPTR